jgi:hypothetical protein
MATTHPPADTGVDDALVDAMIEQDPSKPGRHNARFKEYGTHVWAVLGVLRRTNGDIAATAHEWRMPEEAIRAAIRYHERHKELFDAYFLLDEEEWHCFNEPEEQTA